jgi:hypothetical protein
LRGWITLPLFGRLRLGLSPTRSWLSFPIFGGIRGGVSLPLRRRKTYTLKIKEVGRPSVDATKIRPGLMPGAMVDD